MGGGNTRPYFLSSQQPVGIFKSTEKLDKNSLPGNVLGLHWMLPREGLESEKKKQSTVLSRVPVGGLKKTRILQSAPH